MTNPMSKQLKETEPFPLCFLSIALRPFWQNCIIPIIPKIIAPKIRQYSTGRKTEIDFDIKSESVRNAELIKLIMKAETAGILILDDE